MSAHPGTDWLRPKLLKWDQDSEHNVVLLDHHLDGLRIKAAEPKWSPSHRECTQKRHDSDERVANRPRDLPQCLCRNPDIPIKLTGRRSFDPKKSLRTIGAAVPLSTFVIGATRLHGHAGGGVRMHIACVLSFASDVAKVQRPSSY